MVRGTGKARPLRLRTVEIVTGTATTRAAADHSARLPLSLVCVLPVTPLASSLPLEISVGTTAPGFNCSGLWFERLVRLGGGGGGARLAFCFLGELGAVGIQELAGHGRRVRGWIEAWGKRRVASSSSVLGSGLAGRGRLERAWRRVGTATGSAYPGN